MILQMTPFIMLDGNAKEAIEFYEKALHAKVLFKQTFGEAPDSHESTLPEEAKNRLAHSVLKIGEADLFVADTLPGEPNGAGNIVSICVTTSSVEESQQLFDALQEDGQVGLPLQKVHFSPAYGIVTDKFGVTFLLFTKR